MQLTIEISEKTMKDMLILQAVEEGRGGSYIKVEPFIDTHRYNVQDKVLTIVMNEIKKMQGRNPTNPTY